MDVFKHQPGNSHRLTAAILALSASTHLASEDRWWGIGLQRKTYTCLSKLLHEKYSSILTESEQQELRELKEALSSKEEVQCFPAWCRGIWSRYLIRLKDRLIGAQP